MAEAKCCHLAYQCLNERLGQSTHCFTHVLEDKNNKEYVQCYYVYKNGKRCFSVARKSLKEGLCNKHLAELDRLKQLKRREEIATRSGNFEMKGLVKSFTNVQRVIGETPVVESVDSESEDEDEDSVGIFGRNDEHMNISTSRKDVPDDECPFVTEDELPIE
jgi:hypothetical protein